MLRVIAVAIAMGGGVVLLVAGMGHLRRFGLLRAILVSQALLPYRSLRLIACALVVAEIVVGFGAVLAVPVLVNHASVAFAVEAGLFLMLLAYAGLLRVLRPTVRCGCFGDHGPVSLASLVRTGVLAASASAAAVLTMSPVPMSLPLLMAGACATAVVAYAAPILFRSTVVREEATWRP